MAVENSRFARRSLLFMPGDSMRKIEKAAGWEVDTIIMDMEDGVAQNRKVEARQTIAEALQTLDFGGRERLVRVNHFSTGLPGDEISATIAGRPDGYIVPKVEDAPDLQTVDHLLSAQKRAKGCLPEEYGSLP